MLSQANRVMPLNFDAHVSRCTMPEWPNSAQTCAVSPWLGFRRIWPTDPFGSRTMVICLPWFMLCAQFHKVQSSVRDNSFFTRRILMKWLTSIQRKPPFVRWRFSVLYVHCQRRDTASAIARLGHCVDIGHWMALAANRLQMKPAKTELLWGGPAPNTTSRCWASKPRSSCSAQILWPLVIMYMLGVTFSSNPSLEKHVSKKLPLASSTSSILYPEVTRRWICGNPRACFCYVSRRLL